MPLSRGTSHATIGHNISEMEQAGHPRTQAIAAALNTARRSGAKIPKKRAAAGGPIRAAMGARSLPLQGAPGEGANDRVYAGPLHSHVPGRTDKINLNVKPGSYVVPADVTSMMGEGNTLAGTTVLKVMFGQKALTGDVKAPEGRPNYQERHMEHHLMQPGRMIEPQQLESRSGPMADGGSANPQTQGAIPVIVAGGEHIITPEEIVAKFGDLKHGHNALDHMVLAARAREIERLKNAPPPKK